MNKLSDIDVNKSTEKGYLICKRGWLDKIDRPILAFLFISGMTFTALIFFQFNFNDPRDRNSFAIILLPIIFLFWLYCLYRTIIENRLTCLKTSLNQDQNHELLSNFLKERNYEIFTNSKEIIIVKEESELSLNGYWSKTITFIIGERKVYFNIVKNCPIINPPVLLTHLILRHDLKKYFLKNSLTTLMTRHASH